MHGDQITAQWLAIFVFFVDIKKLITYSISTILIAGAIILIYNFYARQHIAVARICHANSVCPSVRLSVCPSITRVYCIKTAERIIEILSLSDRPIILVFRHQGSLRKSEGVTPNGSAKYKGVAIFDHYAAISRKR